MLPEAKKERLAALLFQRSYESRQVTLASGKQSDFYLDCKQTTLHPEGLYLANLGERDAIKGEITVVVAAAPDDEESHAGRSATFDTVSEIARLRAEGTTDRDIAKIVAKATGRKKSDVYAELVKSSPA